jgi:hypothetical protein
MGSNEMIWQQGRMCVQSAVGERLVAEAARACCSQDPEKPDAEGQGAEDHRVAVEWAKECAEKLEAAEIVCAMPLFIICFLVLM